MYVVILFYYFDLEHINNESWRFYTYQKSFCLKEKENLFNFVYYSKDFDKFKQFFKGFILSHIMMSKGTHRAR